MKLGAKLGQLVQLMQKFVPRSHVVVFRNKSTRSIPLDPKFMFWCVSQCLGAFGIVSLLQTWCKTGWTGAINAKVRATKSCCNFFAMNRLDPSRWNLNLCFGAFYSVWVRLGSLRNCRKLGAKRGQLVQIMQKFEPRSHVVIFCNKRTRCIPLEPSFMFSCVA